MYIPPPFKSLLASLFEVANSALTRSSGSGVVNAMLLAVRTEGICSLDIARSISRSVNCSTSDPNNIFVTCHNQRNRFRDHHPIIALYVLATGDSQFVPLSFLHIHEVGEPGIRLIPVEQFAFRGQ